MKPEIKKPDYKEAFEIAVKGIDALCEEIQELNKAYNNLAKVLADMGKEHETATN